MRLFRKNALLLAVALFAAWVFQSCSVQTPTERRKKPPPTPSVEAPAPAPVPTPAPRETVAVPQEAPAAAPGILRASGTSMVDPGGKPVILKGCNIGNWLMLEMWMLDLKDLRDQHQFEKILTDRFGSEQKERLMELYRSSWFTARDFPVLRSFGFNCIRVPFNYHLLNDDAAPFDLKPDAFKWFDWTVDMARRNGLYVIFDMHGVPGGQSSDHTTGQAGQNQMWASPENQQRICWLWTEIARHFRDSPTVAAYDVINEPFGDSDEKNPLNQLPDIIDMIYRSIRSVDTNHIVIVPGNRAGLGIYGDWPKRGWTNVGFTEHYYPGLFGGDPSPETHAEFMARQIPYRAAWLKRCQAPFLVGEFNVVFQKAGGAPLMRAYYDLYGKLGWAATMWCYKLVGRNAGLGPDSWCMVKNNRPPPNFDPRTSSLQETENYIRWLGTMEYAFNEGLGAALTMKQAPPFTMPEYSPMPVDPPATDALPGGWTATDIAGSLAGGQKVFDARAMEVYGGGADIWKSSDQFRFVWRKASGDFELTATLNALSNSQAYAKAGLMIRSSLDPDAAHFLVNVFPDGQVLIGWRSRKGGTMEQKTIKAVSFPFKLRLRRHGEFLESSYSSEGSDWVKTRIHASDELRRPCYAGLAVLSHDNRCLTTATFTNIQFMAASGVF